MRPVAAKCAALDTDVLYVQMIKEGTSLRERARYVVYLCFV